VQAAQLVRAAELDSVVQRSIWRNVQVVFHKRLRDSCQTVLFKVEKINHLLYLKLLALPKITLLSPPSFSNIISRSDLTPMQCTPEMPLHIKKFFKNRGGGPETNPKELKALISKEFIPLHEYDIWVFGKNAENKEDYTRLRITSKERAGDTPLQGLMKVTFLGGYGYDKLKENGKPYEDVIMRCSDMSRIVTKDTGSFKKRAVIDVNNTAISLDKADSFVQLPLLHHRDLATFESSERTKKRLSHGQKKMEKGEWNHVNRSTVVKDKEKILHRMLLPYYNNLSKEEFFAEFMKDLTTICQNLRESFLLDTDKEEEAVILRRVFPEMWTGHPSHARGGQDFQVEQDSPKSKKFRKSPKTSKFPRSSKSPTSPKSPKSTFNHLCSTTSINSKELEGLPASKFRLS
jgi:hypothetical protein